MPKTGDKWTPEHRENFQKAMEEKKHKGTEEQRAKWRKDSQARRDAKKAEKGDKKEKSFPISAISDGREDRVAGATRQYIKKANGSSEDKRLYIAAKLLDTIDFILKGK